MDTTTLGGDLVTVDNVHTFADTLAGADLLVTTGFFNQDSTLVGKDDNHVLGTISNDPVFGTTTASVFVQIKPISYPFYFGNAGDTVRFNPAGNASDVGVDSVVLCLSYKGGNGDTSALSQVQTLNVYKVEDVSFRDTVAKIRGVNYSPAIGSSPIGTGQVTPQKAIAKKVFSTLTTPDSIDYQIRIKLDPSFANTLYNYDTTTNPANNAFRNDSTFRSFINGFAVIPSGTQGNCLMYVNLAEAKTRLDVFYKKKHGAGVQRVYQSFQMYSTYTTTGLISSTANHIVRNYTAGAEVAGAPTNNNNVFIQATPGTYASIKFPTLMNRPNRIIHRAYLIAEEDPFEPNGHNDIYKAPPYMYVDLKDSVTTTPQKFKPLYLDLNPNSPYAPDQTTYYYPFANVDPAYFGGVALSRVGGAGKPFTRYEINITRYIQQLLTKRSYNYELRLYAPYSVFYPQYPATPISGIGTVSEIPYFNALAGGRVRLGSSTNAAHRMKLVIIYSNL